MPTIIGSKAGTRPYLELDWTETSQDVTNNRTQLNLKLYLRVEYSIGYNARYTGRLQGASFTASAGYLGSPGRYLLHERNIWVNHNSDGKKSVTLSADYNISISWSGTYYSNITLSGNASLTDIPRTSLLNSASITNLANGSGATLSIGRTVYYSGFYHLLSIYDGNTWIWDTGYVKGSPSTSHTVGSTSVNNMLNRMSNTTSKTFTVRLRTYTGNNGSGLIGTKTVNMSVGVDGSVKPATSGLKVEEVGNDVSDHFLQTISRIKAEFGATAGYGASISTRTIIVRKVGGANSQTINGASGTTTNPITDTGTYEVIATARDSRGRTSDPLRTTFTSTAYNQPTIDVFTVTRQANTQTVVDIERLGTWTSLGGKNVLSISIERRVGTGSWGSVETTSGSTGSFSRKFTNGGNSVTTSYDYRLVVSDNFGNVAESIASISTQRVVLDIHKNEGVGIGKIREKGVLDVDGQAYFKGDLYVNDVNTSNAQSFSAYVATSGITVSDTNTFWQSLPQGKYFLRPDDMPNQPEPYGVIDHTTFGGDYNTIFYTQAWGSIYRKSGNNNNNFSWSLIDRAEQGWNSNGNWVRYSDGTQICYNTNFNPSGQVSIANGAMWRNSDIKWTFPKAFTSQVTLFGHCKSWTNWSTGNGATNTTGNFAQWAYTSRPVESMHVMAIGRWN